MGIPCTRPARPGKVLCHSRRLQLSAWPSRMSIMISSQVIALELELARLAINARKLLGLFRSLDNPNRLALPNAHDLLIMAKAEQVVTFGIWRTTRLFSGSCPGCLLVSAVHLRDALYDWLPQVSVPSLQTIERSLALTTLIKHRHKRLTLMIDGLPFPRYPRALKPGLPLVLLRYPPVRDQGRQQSHDQEA